jgi:hypothetical protein
MKACLVSVFLLLPVQSVGPKVGTNDGNIFYISADGRSIQITSEGLDSAPSLSCDGRRVVFVRRTPGYVIDTGLGDVEDNEIWVASIGGNEKPLKVFRGHAGGFNISKNLVVAGFERPQFSADGRKIYFVATTWATSSAVHVLDLSTGRNQFLESGHSVEPICSGQYKGYIIIDRDILPRGGGRYDEYWLFDPNGHRLKAIGDLKNFKEKNGIRR